MDLYDSNPVKINVLDSNFYISSDDINKKNRYKACLKNLSALNPSIKISVFKLNSVKYTEEYLAEF